MIAEPPLNIFLILLLPFFILIRKPRVFNEIYTFFQYFFIFLIIIAIFILGSIALIPIAYLKSLFFKIQKLLISTQLKTCFFCIIALFVFVVFGIPLLFLTLVADVIYLIKFAFKKDLKKVVLDRN
jgi:hypothetical protein